MKHHIQPKSRWLHKQELVTHVVTGLLLLVVVFLLGHKTLSDLDLGWHLAGGLWILENKQVPIIDPFGSDSNFWWCYSWLFEVVVALVYKINGFVAVQIFQTLSIILLVFGLWYCLSSITKNQLSLVLALFCCVLFISPILHLRPQLFSLLLLAYSLMLAESKQLTPAKCCLITILWVNIHVYWVFLPLIIFIYGFVSLQELASHEIATRKKIFATLIFLTFAMTNKVSLRGSEANAAIYKFVVCLLACLINPYGYQSIIGVFNYTFSHSIGYELIKEFQNLSLGHGLYFALFVTSLIILAFNHGKLLKAENRAIGVLLFVFGIAAFFRLKMLPMYGIIFSIFLVKLALFKTKEFIGESSFKAKVIAGCSIVVFLGLVFSLYSTPKILDKRYLELRQLVEVLNKEEINAPVRVLNHFDDGGWLALFFWLKQEDKYKTTIDGRSLVMGEKRLKEFKLLLAGDEKSCEILGSWKTEYAIIPKNFPSLCGNWQQIYTTNNLLLLNR